jgi:NAD+ synthase
LLRTDSDLSQVKRKILSFIKGKVEQSHTDGVILELSGDVNSAVTAYLCVEALGTRRVTGLLMPDLRVSVDEDVVDAKKMASELCLDVREFDIAPVHKAFMKNLEENRLAEANLRARIRMSILYYHANVMNRLVVGAGDRSEFLLGYFTKYGNGGTDILPIADLYRSEVRKLGETLGINRRLVAKKSSRRPRAGQVIEAAFDLDYDRTDEIFRLRLDDGLDVETVSSRTGIPRSKVETIILRYESSAHKRKTSEICSLH